MLNGSCQILPSAYEINAAPPGQAHSIKLLLWTRVVLLTMLHLLRLICMQADALVGVCRDLESNCSRTFTFDMTRFEPPTEAA
jgi:hypothetical protein